MSRTEKLLTAIKEWTDANPYQFQPGGELDENDPKQERSKYFPHVVIHNGRTRMGEELHFLFNDEEDEEHDYKEVCESLKWAISFGAYLCEEGQNWVMHYPDYGFKTEDEAWDYHTEWVESEEGQAEVARLAWLRRIKGRFAPF